MPRCGAGRRHACPCWTLKRVKRRWEWCIRSLVAARRVSQAWSTAGRGGQRSQARRAPVLLVSAMRASRACGFVDRGSPHNGRCFHLLPHLTQLQRDSNKYRDNTAMAE